MIARKVFQFLGRFGLDWFILSLIGMIVLASQWPGPGVADGPFSISSLANIGISFIFFFYGLKLNRSKLVAGLSNWRLHLLVQVGTFILFPLVILALRGWVDQGDLHILWLGTFFLAALPSTVSSSVVMVSIAEGNIPAAIFNASISSLMGIFLTPLWMSIVTEGQQNSVDMTDIIMKLLLQILAPVVLGLLLNPTKLGKVAGKYNKQLKCFDQITILAIVYTAFSESFDKHMFSNLDLVELVLLGACMLALFFLVYFLIAYIARLLGFNREDRITATFCGSKKSLVHGTVMAKVIFMNSPLMGILLLPIMLYHALQLIAVSIIAQGMAKRHRAEKVL
ncbi:bile acid:sodium symporter family protein [Paraflavitalea sp. CAU 1676]|uniref:bile acid:sodium symporter family protein n=1 Tax=Paraflavitalea sp. CAU 1676 TaxID=3032598 RepID=UPI0023D985D8|nr:bile acid:sodium symporter family protein [Paraflavitalea sp. CAU 1676]MDF2189073.1 bile acid:sodium symporter [Paraflavitalea sp. CAU 1676]